MSDETIEPALTEAEWSAGEKRLSEDTNADSVSRDERGRIIVQDEEAGRWFYGGGICEVAVDLRHALAALCLHDQPFGFTWEDVDALREEVGSGISMEPEPRPGGEKLWDLADRIEALLPPRETE